MGTAGIGSGLTLVTGATGSGKTALVVSLLADIGDRPMFVMGIPELAIPHEPCPPVAQWVERRPDPDDEARKMPYFCFPAGAIVVLDEAQRVFRPRSTGSQVPDEVAAFETRRHTGVDFVLITQHPMLLDANVRRLVTRHIHVHCTFYGRYLLEWVGVGAPDEGGSRELAARSRYKLPEKAFGLYKSSELHTKPVVKRSWLLGALPIALLVAVGGGWYGWQRLEGRKNAKAAEAAVAQDPGDGAPLAKRGSDRGPVTTRQYLAEHRPRVEGLPHTAPVYDGITQPVEAPYPVGCVQSRSACRCYDQRGGRLDTPAELCAQLIQRPIFADWRSNSDATAHGSATGQPSAVRSGLPERASGGPGGAGVAGVSERG